MKQIIDFLIINNAPSFYKINLYNELAKKCKIHVIFLGLTDQVVINQTFENDILFSYDLVSMIQIEKRNKLDSVFKVFSISKKFNYKKIIYGGYIDFEVKIMMFLTPKSKNCLQFESSIRESKVTGVVALIKKMLLSRISTALPSGILQSEVFKALHFKGKIIETKGVGIFNKTQAVPKLSKKSSEPIRYLYVGRLIELKNIKKLIVTFNELNKPLTIVGSGVLEEELKALAKENIEFTGFIPNNEIYKEYSKQDVFILPSLSEPWGLVVEEAIYYGLPVMVSEAVGCQEEMVIKPNTGVVFTLDDENDLIKAIDILENKYQFYKDNCLTFDFNQRDREQVQTYLTILKS